MCQTTYEPKRLLTSDGDPNPLWNRILIHISGELDSILIFIKHSLSVLKISKKFIFFLRRTLGEYSKIFLKTDPCPFLVKYSLDVLKKKTKVLDISNIDKKWIMKINTESSPPEIWIRISFHKGYGSPSLLLTKGVINKKGY